MADLNPSKDIKELRRTLWNMKKVAIHFALREILREVLTIERNNEVLTQANLELTIAQMPEPDREVPF